MMELKKLSRGIRNNNPGNLLINDQLDWIGKVPCSRNTDGTYEQFHSPLYGLRALAKTLQAYMSTRHANTIRTILRCWAFHKDIESYIDAVALAAGINPDTPVTQSHIADIVAAIILVENGNQPYDIELIRQSVNVD